MASDPNTTSIDATWKRFVATSRIDSRGVRPEIGRSWLRCDEADVDPSDGLPRRRLSGVRFRRLLDEKSDLLAVGEPFAQRLYRVVEDTGFMVMLADANGYILDVKGKGPTLDSASEINLGRGFAWSEAEAGTNGIGTALAIGKPVQVSGAEHYCRRVHQWTCSAAPIFDDRGRILGVFQMSGPAGQANSHTMGMVVAAGEAIGGLVAGRRDSRASVLVDSALRSIWYKVADGIIVLDASGRIDQVNPAAERMLHQAERAIKGRMFNEFVDRTREISSVLNDGTCYDRQGLVICAGGGRIRCVSDGKPIKDDDGKIAGAVLFVNPLDKRARAEHRESGARARYHFQDIVGGNPLFLERVRLAVRAAGTDGNVLLQGESGTGKEVFAQAIHNGGPRRDGPFVAVNCGALPRDLVVSELFGYADGAFTGSVKGGRPGKFELASGGTLFLDEIEELPLDQQVTLLRALQDKSVTRIGGGNSVIATDVRIVCASNKDLRLELSRGTFRPDLYYRLAVILIDLPPLRDRLDDIPLLFEAFFKEKCVKVGRYPPRVDPEVLSRLSGYDWPGNIREFQNILERIATVADGEIVGVGAIPEEIALARVAPRVDAMKPRPADSGFGGADARAMVERRDKKEILSTLALNRGNVSKAALALGISRATLYRRMRALGIDGKERAPGRR